MLGLFWDDHYGEPTPFGMIAIGICIIFSCVSLLFGVMVITNHATCENTAEIVGTNYEWRVFGGCYLEFNGQMVPKDVWQFFTFGDFGYDRIEIYK